jgi:hypothetical protein
LFIKDILAMANTPRSDAAYIITGIKLHDDSSREYLGVDIHPDDSDLQDQLKIGLFRTFDDQGGGAPRRCMIRRLSKSNLPRPYIWRLICLRRLTCPSVGPFGPTAKYT